MSKRILVVEDHEDNRRILRDLLTSAGYEMIDAVTGKEGVAMAEKPSPRPHPDGHPTPGTRRVRGNATD